MAQRSERLRRDKAAYEKGRQAGFEELERLVREVIVAIGQFASAGGPEHARIQEVAADLVKLLDDRARLRKEVERLTGLVEQLRALASSREQREAKAGEVIEEARQLTDFGAIPPEQKKAWAEETWQQGRQAVRDLVAEGVCPVCYETAPEPASLCLVRHMHPLGHPCQYSREGEARTAAVLEGRS